MFTFNQNIPGTVRFQYEKSGPKWAVHKVDSLAVRSSTLSQDRPLDTWPNIKIILCQRSMGYEKSLVDFVVVFLYFALMYRNSFNLTF